MLQKWRACQQNEPLPTKIEEPELTEKEDSDASSGEKEYKNTLSRLMTEHLKWNQDEAKEEKDEDEEKKEMKVVHESEELPKKELTAYFERCIMKKLKTKYFCGPSASGKETKIWK